MKTEHENKMSKKTQKMLSIGGIVVFVLFTVAITWFVGRPMLQFVNDPERFRAWVDASGILGRLAFIGMVVLQIIVAVIPGEPLEIGAGYAFGAIEGTLLCVAGIFIGSLLVYLFVRYFGRRAVEVFFPPEKINSIKFLQNPKKLNMVVFIAFFIPGTPKDLLSYLIGLTPMKLGTWLLISTVARLPSVVTSTIGGDALGMQNYQFAIIVFAITLVISVIGLIIFNRVYKKEPKPNEDNEQ